MSYFILWIDTKYGAQAHLVTSFEDASAILRKYVRTYWHEVVPDEEAPDPVTDEDVAHFFAMTDDDSYEIFEDVPVVTPEAAEV